MTTFCLEYNFYNSLTLQTCHKYIFFLDIWDNFNDKWILLLGHISISMGWHAYPSKWPKPCLEAVLKFLENVLFRNAVRGKSSRILESHCTQPIQPWQWFLCCWTPLHGNHFCLEILIFSDYNWLLRAKQHSIQTFSLNILTNCACFKKKFSFSYL